jgi:DNA-binding PadR family transcriptional regulator
MSKTLNATAASLLGFLHLGPMTGWDLVVTAQVVIGDFWSLTQSQVYRELAAMAEAGLVTAGERGRRDRRPYELTDAGRAEFAEWVRREPGPETIRFPLLLTIGFGARLDPDRLARYIDDHRRVHQAQLRKYQELNEVSELTPHQRATLAFGLQYEQAVLDWMDELPALLNP